VTTWSFSSTKVRFTDVGGLFQDGDLAHGHTYQWIFQGRNGERDRVLKMPSKKGYCFNFNVPLIKNGIYQLII